MNITIYGKPNCPQCQMAKQYLDVRNIPYDYKQLDVDFVREDVMAIAPHARSYPVIVVNEEVTDFSRLSSLILAEASNTTQLLTE